MTHLKLMVLGAPHLERDGTPLELETRKALAMLIYLATTGQSHSREALAALFWPEHDQSRARTYLRRALWMLKNGLGEEPLLIERYSVAVNPESDLWVDAAHFRHLLASFEQGQPSDDNALSADRLAILAEAADLYRGDFLTGFTLRDAPEFDDWQFFEAEGLRQDFATALEKLVQGHIARKTVEAAIPYARRWLTLDPLHEPAHRTLMQLYVNADQQAAALHQYEECVRLLDEEFGLPPEMETTTLFEAIKAKRLVEPFLKTEAQRSQSARKKKSVPQPEPEPPVDAEPSSDTLGRYELLNEIGRGGFATVYCARDTVLGRLVALKELKAALLTETSGIKRFRREAKLIAHLDHPHIVPIYDVGQAQGRHFIVMRLIEGQSLADRLAEQKRLTWPEAVALLADVATGLDYAHRRGILHRDLKPANILLDPERGPLLSDFGLAKLEHDQSISQSGRVVGTTHYIAPELWDGQPATPQTDIYALGCMLYEMLTGEKIFAGETPVSIMRAHFQPLTLPEQWPADVPTGINHVLMRALAMQPDQRYASAAELVAALTELTEGDTVDSNRQPDSQLQARQTESKPAQPQPESTSAAEAPALPCFLTEDNPPEPAPVFVARERELADLKAALHSAQTGQGQILFVIGGAGRGKTLLTQEFTRRMQAENSDLVVISGYCDAMTGISDPYMPFRGALTMLTGDVEAKWAGGLISRSHACRLWELMPQTLPALVDHAPDLIGNFVPAAALQKRAATITTPQDTWFNQLTALAEAKPDAGLEQQRIFSQYTALLKAVAAQRPILFIIEDLHWIDTASSGLLFHLSREIADSRILIIGTYRPEEVPLSWSDARHPLSGLVSELKRQHGDIWLDLDDMAAIEGRQFIDAYLDTQPNQLDTTFREALFRHTGGYALFTVELLRDMQERGDITQDESGAWIVTETIDWQTLPVKVEGVIEKRIQSLEEDWQAALTVASIEGEIFTAEVVARVQGLEERTLVQQLSRDLDKRHRLVTAQTLERVGRQRLSRYRFRHNLFQHYLYYNLDELERGYLHEAVGDALEELYAGRTEEVAVQLAWHFQEAGLIDKAVDYLQSAAAVATRMYAHTEAIAFYRQALSLVKDHNIGQEHLIRLYGCLGRALELNAQFDAALANYDEMEAVARQLRDRPMELAALMAQVTLYATPTPVHDPVKGPALGEETLALARKLGDQAAEAKTLWNLALGGMWSGRTHAGIANAEKAVMLARQLNLTELLGYALNDLGMLYAAVMDVEQAIPTLYEAGKLWRELDSLPMLTDNLSMTAMAHVAAGDYKQAVALSNEAFQLSESSNNLWGQSYSLMMVCLAYWEFGQPGKALTTANESVRLGELAGFMAAQVLAGGHRAAMVGHLGAIEQGLDMAQQAVTIAETHFPHFRCHPLGILTQLYLMAGHLDEAEAVIARGKDDPYRDAHPTWNMRINIAEAELALKQENYEQSLAIADQWLPKLRQYNLRAYTPAMLQVKSQAQLALGHVDAARVTLLEACAILESTGSQATLWPILFALSQLETNAVAAQSLHHQARQIVESMAAHIDDPRLQSSFLNLPQVQAVLKTK
ncbi:MAG: protein kinase [Anaerolineae bacterium]|nr:protein kinase [Anaerolineae bacterium]